jgi:hypothetical protein
MTAHNHADLLASFGVNLNELGCVMLEVEPLPVGEWLTMSGYDPDVWVSSPDGHPWSWVKGPVAEKGAHVTVKYGFLQKAYASQMQAAVHQLMADYEPGMVLRVGGIEIFPEPAVSELGYACIVARIDDSPLRAWNAALSMLPHVDTYAEYKPHLTLGYVQKHLADDAAVMMRSYLPNYVTTTGLSLGDRILA